jgi:hypothetical protein
MDTTTALENATDLLLQANNRYSKIVERLDSLENVILGTAQAATLEGRIKELEDDFTASSLQLQDSNALLSLINNAHTKINQLIDGTIPVELQYNTDVIFAGKGTNVDKSIAGKIKVNNSVEGYVVNDVFQWDIASSVVSGSVLGGTNLFDNSNSNINGVWTKLNSYSNRLSLKNKLSADPLNGNLNIYVDDSVTGWTKGQSFKIAFDAIDVDGNNIKVWTNKSGGWQNIVDIDPSQLLTNKPYIELVCTDPVNFVFEVDILR